MSITNGLSGVQGRSEPTFRYALENLETNLRCVACLNPPAFSATIALP